MPEDKSEENVLVGLPVPDTLEEAMEPLERSFWVFAQSLQPDLEGKLTQLLGEAQVEAKSIQKGAIVLLASGVSYRKTAALLDIGESTAWRIKSNPKFEPIILALKEVYAHKIFQWAMSLLPWSFRAMFDNLTLGNLDQRRLAAQAMFKLVGEQLTGGATPPPAGLPLPRREAGIMDIFPD